MGPPSTSTEVTTPTPYGVLLRDGSARLLRFRRPLGAPAEAGVVLLVPSLINRWYVLDLRPGASLVEALVADGLDVWCMDWGAASAEDRYLGWDAVVARLARMVRAVRRRVGGGPIGLLGYCIGGTLATIHTALHPAGVSSLVNLAGPIDFAEAGVLAHFTDRRWFAPEGLVAAGNLPASLMQGGFVAMRPSRQPGKYVLQADIALSQGAAAERRARMDAFRSLDEWASDNIDFPAAAYVTWIRSFYQDNQLVQGQHQVCGRRVDLGTIACPLLTIVTTADTICPPKAAIALGALVRSEVVEVLEVPGGHVGAVVGRRATTELYPAVGRFFAAWCPPVATNRRSGRAGAVAQQA